MATDNIGPSDLSPSMHASFLFSQQKNESAPLIKIRSTENYPPTKIDDITFPSGDYFAASPNLLLQFRALFYQRINIQKRRYCTNICQIFVPLFLILVIGFFQLLTDSILNQADIILPSSDIMPLPVSLNFTVPCAIDILNDNRPTNCTNDFRILKYIVDNPRTCKFLLNFLKDLNPIFISNNNVDCSNPRRLYQILPQYSLFELPYYFFSSNDNSEEIYGSLNLDGKKNGFLGSFVEKQYKFSLKFDINPKFDDPFFNDHALFSNKTVDNIYLPFFVNLNTSNSDNSLLAIYKHMLNFRDLKGKNQSFIDDYSQRFKTSPANQDHYFATLSFVQKKNFEYIPPFSALHINKFNSTFLDVLIISPKFQLSLINYETHRGNQLLNLLCNNLLNSISNLSLTNRINTWMFQIPERGNVFNLNIFNLVGNLLFPLLTTLIMPLFVNTLVHDKEGKHLIMMKQSTLHEFSYLIINFVYFFVVYILTLFPAFVSTLAFEIRIFRHSSFVLLFIIHFIWGCSLISLALFFSIFFNRARTAVNFTYIVVVLGVIISFLFSLMSTFHESITSNFIYMLYPPFAYYRVLFLLNYRCQQYQCFQLDVFSSWNTLVQSIFFLSLGSLLVFFLSIYLLMVFPNENGNRKHPLFCLLYICRLFNFNIVSKYVIPYSKQPKNYEKMTCYPKRNPVESKEFPICMYRLRKVYKTGKRSHIAVKGFTLQVQTNECFGLLGSNGAGKTTLISMLTGVVAPSSGSAFINEYSLKGNILKIYKKLGYCPQNDILYPELTSAEHILFYSRLKGVKIKYEKHVLNDILKISKLLNFRNVKVNVLSGGLKRRLSIALSIINNPTILILDEPTAGLDPLSRNHVWNLIKHLRKDRAIIITTHNMEEADTLCTKIGILHFGILRAVGTLLELKNIYTQGYEIKIIPNPDSICEIREHVHISLPQAKFIDYQGDFLFYKIPNDQVDNLLLFKLIANLSKLSLINDWEVRSSSLEDVLLNVSDHIIDKRDAILQPTIFTKKCLFCLKC